MICNRSYTVSTKTIKKLQDYIDFEIDIRVIENKIFKLMLGANLIGIVLDVSSMIIIPMQKYELFLGKFFFKCR